MPYFLCLVTFICSSFAWAEIPRTFKEAKQSARYVYRQLQPLQSFYCQCNVRYQGKKLIPDLKSCQYKIRKNTNRAQRIEWEHIVSAWEMGHERNCWKNAKGSSRRYCRKNDASFRLMEAELHNLVPAIGEVNGDRSNYTFGLVRHSQTHYGTCPVKINFKKRIVEPPQRIRGNIARIYFFMEKKHGLTINHHQKQMFKLWSKLDPVDNQECERDRLIARKIGYHNSFVAQACTKI